MLACSVKELNENFLPSFQNSSSNLLKWKHLLQEDDPKCPEEGASKLFEECFCHAGYSGTNCSEPHHLPECAPNDDRCFFHSAYGVASVNEERWKSAQSYENETWAQQRTSDRNEEHAFNFLNYATLFLQDPVTSTDKNNDTSLFGDMIEFGAGPFTQSLTIFQKTKRYPRSITLLEPMAETYMETVHACRYKERHLDGLNTTILAMPAEEFESSKQFDTVLFVNFIEHVKDAFSIYDIAFDSLRPDGFVIFHERFWPNYNGIETANTREFDLHPIRLNGRFAHWLATEFDLLYEKEQNERWGNLGYYWIGRKHKVPMSRLVDTLRKKMDKHAERLRENGWNESNVWGNIYNGRDLQQSREYMAYARSSNVKTICEIGFAGGHSTLAYMVANPNATIYSFDDFGKPELTTLAFEILKDEKPDIHLRRGDSTTEVPQFSVEHPDVYCDVISVDGAHHAHFPDEDLNNFKFLSNYPNVVLIDDYHKNDWPAVYNGVDNRVTEGSMKIRHVSESSIVFRGKHKQWAIGEYELLTLIVATMQLERLESLKAILEVATKHPVVQQVIVLWNGPDMPKPVSDLARSPLRGNRVTVIQKHVNSLNNRYDPTLPIHTGAVMIVDDDIEIYNQTIDCAFGAWKGDPSRLFSFGAGRHVGSDGYGLNYPPGTPGANFLLPRLVFHRKFLSVYFDESHQKIREYVDKQGAHCDDIAFAAVITKYMNKSMTQVPAPHFDRALPGMFTKGNRWNDRDECSKEIVAMLNWTLPDVEAGPQCDV